MGLLLGILPVPGSNLHSHGLCTGKCGFSTTSTPSFLDLDTGRQSVPAHSFFFYAITNFNILRKGPWTVGPGRPCLLPSEDPPSQVGSPKVKALITVGLPIPLAGSGLSSGPSFSALVRDEPVLSPGSSFVAVFCFFFFCKFFTLLKLASANTPLLLSLQIFGSQESLCKWVFCWQANWGHLVKQWFFL